MHQLLAGCTVMGVLLAVPSPARAQAVLGPDELLRSVERSLPLLDRARQDVEVAEGELEQARGSFDLGVTASNKLTRGFYDNERLAAAVVQPLAFGGATLTAGYRLGRGLFAPYDTAAQTLGQGEFMVGAELPLLRNRSIDARRADRASAELGVAAAERSLDKARLSFYKQALVEYWDWAAAGAQRLVAQSLLDLASARDQQLADSVALGQIAPVERTENRRAILQRQSAVVAAERQLEMKAIDLSLYYRAPDGRPERPAVARVPALSPPLAEDAFPNEEDAIRVAFMRRPELQALRLKREQQDVALRYAENLTLPYLNLYTDLSRDIGAGAPSRVPSIFQGGMSFAVPLQNRAASGKRVQARAKLEAVRAEIRWTEDQIRTEVQNALSARQAARRALDLVSQEVTVARELEALERDRFTLGDSTQFLVNLRELATADAAFREARALADYQKAVVAVEAATGTLLDRIPPP